MSSFSKAVLEVQKKKMTLLIAVFFLGVTLFTYLLNDDSPKKPAAKEININLPTDKINTQEVWMSQINRDKDITSKRLDFLEESLLEAKKREELYEKERVDLKKELFKLNLDLKTKSEASYKQEEQILINSKMNDLPIDPFQDSQFTSSINLEEIVMPTISKKKVLNISNSIPAGTTVKALLVSSVDAACGVNAPGDPQPVKVRLLDDGHLPKKVKALLKGGLIIASAYGDISSERVYMRLERLTQVKNNGDYVETAVTGFISGEDGKYGVRGVVVDRSDKLVKSAAISGFLGGVGQFLQATVNAQNISDATDGKPNNLKWDLLKEGGSAGSKSALDKLSEYYIKRAEQLLPVIQVAAGRIVDVTFTFGTDVGDLHSHEKVNKFRERSKKGFSDPIGSIIEPLNQRN